MFPILILYGLNVLAIQKAWEIFVGELSDKEGERDKGRVLTEAEMDLSASLGTAEFLQILADRALPPLPF